MTVEISYFAPKRLVRPHFWIEIDGINGPLFSATMLTDGFSPSFLEGRGQIRCEFAGLPLMPNTYSVRMGVRSHEGVRVILRNTKVGFFNVFSPLAEHGFAGELADSFSAETAPIVVPYTWYLPDGTCAHFRIC